MDGVPHELVAPPVELGPLPARWRRRRRGVREETLVGLGPALLAVGGGRRIVQGAAAAAAAGLPWVAVPTTYAPAWACLRPPPARVLVDPALPASLSGEERAFAVAAARAVAVEGLWAPDGSPSVRWVALSALRTLYRAVVSPARVPPAAVSRAAALAAVGAGNCAPGLLSVMAQACSAHGLPWAVAMARLLPAVGAFQAAAAGDAMETVGDVVGATHAGAALDALVVPAPPRLPGANTLEAVAREVLGRPWTSPRTPDRGDVRRLLVAAWS